MEETPEGLAIAAATRQAVKEKKRALEQHGQSEQPAPKRPARPVTPCQHEVAIPKGYNMPNLDPALHGTIEHPLWDGEMAKTYPFQLDPFQATAIACIERDESVLVAAHTSAGKTVVAEYAIAKALKAQQKVIYTSPIKALSNQKYFELKAEFSDVGLMTGDVTIDPNASCLVMTTEILRAMMYRGSEILREVSWVIFDEVHYMKDRERGVVWEEVIIFMEKDARMVFLSATLPNSLEFAEWIASVHRNPCHVVSTDYRPTPLVHYVYPIGGNGLYLLVDDKGKFRSENFKKLTACFPEPEVPKTEEDPRDKKKGGKGGGGKKEGKKPQGPPMEKEVLKLVRLLKEKKLEPVIVFSFNRQGCENYARVMMNSGSGGKKKKKDADALPPVDFNSEEEKKSIEAIVNQALGLLSEEDKQLPFIQTMVPMLKRGIGVHHSGLLPILKELVEILFQEGLVKCLFATETFAMGLNMPAKTVVFTQLDKWDGTERRFIESGEYIQMSGRAGRRGKDSRGLTILMADAKLDEATCRTMMQGGATSLLSSFKLSYYTLLNLLIRQGGSGAKMEYVIARSFSQFQFERTLPELKEKMESLRKEAEVLGAKAEAAQQIIEAQNVIEEARKVIMPAMLQPDRSVNFLRPGRIVRVKVQGNRDLGYGVVVSVVRDPKASASAADSYLVDVLLRAKLPDKEGRKDLEPCSYDAEDEDAQMVVIPFPLSHLTALSTLRIAIPHNLKDSLVLDQVRVTLKELIHRYPGGVLPELHPVEDMGIETQAVAAAVKKEAEARAKIAAIRASAGGAEDAVEDQVAELRKKAELLAEADELERQMRANQVTNFQEEFTNRLAVLTKLGYIDKNGVLSNKGKVASFIETADELITSELMLDGTFGALDKHQLAAVVSCLLEVESTQEEIQLTKELGTVYTKLGETARHIADVSNECKVAVDAEEYAERFKPTLMNVVYSWSKGASFKEICEMTSVFEGSIIRAIRRQIELMVNFEDAAKSVGDVKLAALFEASRETLRRGIPFTASLYV